MTKGFLVRNLRVITYLTSRGWVMRDNMDGIHTRSTKIIKKYLEYLTIESGVRMFPPYNLDKKEAKRVLQYAKDNYNCGMKFDPPVVAGKKAK